jgi:hypothetical protein
MMNDAIISVIPVDGGWSVLCSVVGQPLMFLSGSRAEQEARSLGKCLATLGHDAQVQVHDRRKTLIGTVRYFSSD